MSGSTVARRNNYGVLRLFIDMVGYVTQNSTTVVYDKIDGIHKDIGGNLKCVLHEILKADVILFSWQAIPQTPDGPDLEFFIRDVLALARPPLLIYISHCTMLDTPAFPLDNSSAANTWYSASREFERSLAAYYNLTFVSACDAFAQVRDNAFSIFKERLSKCEERLSCQRTIFS